MLWSEFKVADVQEMLELGGRPNQPDKDQVTPLYIVGSLDVLKVSHKSSCLKQVAVQKQIKKNLEDMSACAGLFLSCWWATKHTPTKKILHKTS